MITFILSIVALIVGYIVYGNFVQKIFGIKENKKTPALEYADGVDFIAMPTSKTFLIQFLNIAGTGPIFGAIAGAMWGPAAFIWIVFGCIFAGATHDYLIGMMSVRRKGESVSELVGDNLGNFAKQLMRVFSIILLLLVGVVFISSPAQILAQITPLTVGSLVLIIILYYVLATIMPIDKIIGKIYPVFGFALLFMALGIFLMLIFKGYDIPELTLTNVHPAGKSIFPYLCISIACGAISGFHATQSPLMARCLQNEKEGKIVFYGAMITEGVVALIWAAAAMSFFGGVDELGNYLSAKGNSAATAVNAISITLLGPIGGVLAILGVVAAPISSGDTAFRSARINIADIIKMPQGPIINRFIIAIPLFVIGAYLTTIDFQIIWRYFGWSNQTLATIALWAAAMYLAKRDKNHYIASIPAVFMTVVVVSYIIIAPEGLVKFLPFDDIKTIETVGLITGFTAAISSFALFMLKVKNLQKHLQKPQNITNILN